MQDTALKIYEFMNTVEKLCYVRRDILRRDGAKETDSDHIMKLAFLLLMVLPYIKQPIDAQRVLELALVHDLVEADAGDISRLKSERSADVRAQKKAMEMAAIEKYRGELPAPIGQKIYDLFMEYEERKTPEAKLVKIFDKYEGDMQALKENKGLRFYQDGRYEFILNYLREDVATAENIGEPLLAELQKLQLDTARENIEDLKNKGLL
ncbi:MAG: HD domain-containing protein [Rickettsiales bacterium]|jgi:putative hydrolase of HD superfamily|nr:HD domain-containing protein [Rickettsiales bacterium]